VEAFVACKVLNSVIGFARPESYPLGG